MTTKIYLNFIFKNEEKVLPRMLSSCVGIIDGIVCVDTGSTDNSQQIIKDFCNQNNLTCEISEAPFIDFSQARNEALNALVGKEGNYAILLDCDEQLIREKNFDKKKFVDSILSYDIIISNVHYNNLKYDRRSIFKISTSLCWVYPVHEILVCNGEIKASKTEMLYTLVKPDGNSWSNGAIEKYKNYVDILLNYIKKDKDPRCVFYLAQSYRDSEQPLEAIKWYKERVEMDSGFYEEKYISQLNIANLMAETGHSEAQVIHEYLKCHEIDKARNEHNVNLVEYLRKNGRYSLAYYFGKNAIKHDKIPERVLFIKKSAYSSYVRQLHNLSGFMSGEKISITICILSNAKNREMQEVTRNCIQSLLESENSHIKLNILVMEQQSGISYNYINTQTYYPIASESEFNYNRSMNRLLQYSYTEFGQPDYVCFCNNDLIFRQGWASNILKAMNYYPDIESASPFCPNFTSNDERKYLAHYGLEVRKQLYGWCIFLSHAAYKKIGKLDEEVKFWFSDNIYADQLTFHGIKHALITTSEVEHLESTTLKTLDSTDKTEATTGQHHLYIMAKQKYQ